MSRRSAAVLSAVVLGLTASVACSNNAEPRLVSTTPAATQDGGWLAVRPARWLRGDLGGLIRAGDGSTLVWYSRWPAEDTLFRVYDESWEPRTPLLVLDGSLTPDRALQDGFVGLAYQSRPDGTPRHRSWVTISTDGEVQKVAAQPTRSDPARKMLEGDLRLIQAGSGRLAYRPSADEVFKARSPRWASYGLPFYSAGDRSMCVPENGRRAGPIHTTMGDVAPWRTHDTGFVPDSDPSRRVFGCSVHPGRLVVSTMREDPTAVYTVDTETDLLLSQHRLGHRLNGYDTSTFSDGTLAAGTHAAGLMVGTDSTNAEIVFRPWPLPRNAAAWWMLLADTVVIAPNNRKLYVSTDRAVSWSTVDLQMPPAR